MNKFRLYQKVVVPGFLINGDRLDIAGTVQGYSRGTNYGKVNLLINGTLIAVDEDRLVDYDEFWDKKNKEKKDENS